MLNSCGTENTKELESVDNSQKSQAKDNSSVDEVKVSGVKESHKPLQKEDEVVKKKYGGLLAKKPPLISKDHERAFFDSADWALGKQGAMKSKGPLEALRPKLEPTPHQQVRTRLSSSAPADDADGEGTTDDNIKNGESYEMEVEEEKCGAKPDEITSH